VRVRLGLGPARLREVEAQETTLPDRTDWTFAFAETGLLRDVEGEARVQVRVAGDEIVDMTRSVRVPEAWAREQREIESRRTIMAGGLALLLIVCFAGAAVVGVVTWSRGRLVRGVASRIAAPAIVAVTLSAANSWPATEAGFSTAQPWGLQAAAVAIALVFAVLLAGPAIGSVGALGVTWLRDVEAEPGRRGLPVALGLLLGGFLAAVRTAFAGAPALPDYTGAATRIPSLDAALRSVLPYLLVTVALLAVALTRRRFRERHLIQSSLLTLLAVGAVVLVPVSLQASLPLWGLAALLGYGVLLIVLRIVAARPTWVPTILGAAMVLDVLGLAWDAPYAGARPGGVLAALVLALLAWSSTRLLSSGGEDPHGPSQSVDGSRASVGSV
jgi:MFS family permease